VSSDSNLFVSTSRFFSYPGYTDCFQDPSFTLTLNIQRLFKEGLVQYFSTLNTYVKSDTASDLFAFEVFNNVNFFSPAAFQSTELFDVAKTLAKDIKSSTSDVSGDYSVMTNVFPEYRTVIEELEFHVLEDDGSLVEKLSTPDVKLYYPEPFIASPSFVHEDLWFIHILHYQHWLWFMFISLIMFYFITFINVVR